jgi:hypothetical protein
MDIARSIDINKLVGGSSLFATLETGLEFQIQIGRGNLRENQNCIPQR